MKSLDALINYLLEEVALCGKQGGSYFPYFAALLQLLNVQDTHPKNVGVTNRRLILNILLRPIFDALTNSPHHFTYKSN